MTRMLIELESLVSVAREVTRTEAGIVVRVSLGPNSIEPEEKHVRPDPQVACPRGVIVWIANNMEQRSIVWNRTLRSGQ